MTWFIDTSALYALVSSTDAHHRRAVSFLSGLAPDDILVTHNYIVVEMSALLQRRLGIEALRRFNADLLPRIDLVWITEQVHRVAEAALIAGNERNVSLVDRTSFEVMRRLNLRDAFAFDKHFSAEGFQTVPLS